MRQRIDFHRAGNVVATLGAGERVRAVDVHGAGAANALAAGTAQRQRRVDLHHRLVVLCALVAACAEQLEHPLAVARGEHMREHIDLHGFRT